MNTDPTDELTRLRAENAMLQTQHEALRLQIERLTLELQCFDEYGTLNTLKDERDSLRAQLATISAERDEARKDVAMQRGEGENSMQTFSEVQKSLMWQRQITDRTIEMLHERTAERDCLTAAAVVKDAALRKMEKRISFLFSRYAKQEIAEVDAALSDDCANPLLTDVKAAAVALKDLTLFLDKSDPRCLALARLARWISPAIEQKGT